MSSLVTSEVATRQRFETAEADARKAAAALLKAQAALEAEKQQLAVLDSQKREEEARLLQARATLRLAQNDLDNTVIRAPVAGIAGNRAGQIGQYVKPGTQLLSLVPLPRVYVTANFKETQLTLMRPGQPAEISVDAYPDQIIEGRVESFAPASGAEFSLLPPDNATGNFTKIVQRVPVRIALPADGPLSSLLRPGLSVTVSVDTRAEGSATAEGGIVGTAAGQTSASNSQMTLVSSLRRVRSPRVPHSDSAAARRTGDRPRPAAAAAQADPAGLAAPMGRRPRHGLRDVHGAPRHPDRHQLADPDPGRAVGERRRDQLGADLLPDRRSGDDPAVGDACRG